MAGAGAVRAGRAFVELFAEDARLYRSLDAAKARLLAFGSLAAKVGLASGAGATAVLAPMTRLFATAGGRAAEIDQLAKRFGATTEEVSALAYAFERYGVGLDEFKGILDGVATRLSDAASQGDDFLAEANLQAQALIRLPLPEALDRIIDGLRQVTLEEDKITYAGAWGLGNMLDLVRKGSAGLADLKREGGAAGALVTADEAARSRAVMQEYTATWQALRAAIQAAGLVLLPAAEDVTSFGRGARAVVADVRRWVAASGDLFPTVARVAAGAAAAGLALTALGVVARTAGVGLGVLVSGGKVAAGVALAAAGAVGSLLSAGVALVRWLAAVRVGALLAAAAAGIAAGAKLVWAGAVALVTGSLAGLKVAVLAALTPYGLLAVAAAALTALFITQTGVGERLGVAMRGVLSDLAASWQSLKETATTAWGGIVAALQTGDLEAAGQVAVAALKVAWAEGMNFLTRQWVAFKSVVVDGWHDIGNFVEKVVAGWQAAWIWLRHGRAEAQAFTATVEAQQRERAEANRRFRGDQLTAAAAAVARAKAELADLSNKAKGGLLEGEAADKARLLSELARKGQLPGAGPEVFRAVKGTYAVSGGGLGQQLGYGDTYHRKVVNGVEKIAADAGRLPAIAEGIKALISQLTFK